MRYIHSARIPKICLIGVVFIFSCHHTEAQCPTGSTGGTVNINAPCTIAAGEDYTIGGDLNLNDNLTLGAGAILRVSGTLSNAYVPGATTRTISGGTIIVNAVSTGNNLTLNLTGSVAVEVIGAYYGGYHGGLTMTNASLEIGTTFSEGFQQGTITLNNSDIVTGGSFTTSGGGTQLSLSNGSSIDAGGNFYFTGGAGRTLTVNDSEIFADGSFTIGEQSGSSITNGSAIEVGGDFLNDNGADMVLDNSTILLTSGNLLNDYQATIIAQNGSEITLSNGNMQTEDQSSLTIDASDVYVNGDMNNDYRAQLVVRNSGDLTITGDFNNGMQPGGGGANEGFVDVDGGSISVGGDLNNTYASSIDIDGGGSFAVTGNVTNAQAATIDVPDGTFSYGGDLSDDFDGVTSSSADGECTDGCCGSGCTLLPVEILEFKGQPTAQGALLTWRTASELNNDFFTIERSVDGVVFMEIARISGAGTTKVISSYQYTDVYSGSQVYYRLSQTDLDGEFEILKAISLTEGQLAASLKVYPNPIGWERSTLVQGATADMYWSIYSLSGSKLLDGSFIQSQELDVRALEQGVYFLRINRGSDSWAERIVIR